MKRIYLIFILLLTFSCKNNSSEKSFEDKIGEIKKEAIDMHDIVMEQMGAVKSLKDSLKLIIVQDSSVDAAAKVYISKLDSADKAMWEWMHSFDLNYKGETDSLTLSHFQGKYKDIEHVKLLFDSSLVSARKYIKRATDGRAQ
ncbi:MAG: hypothetical protein KDC79_08190 [Cyclobacteriaceae bacterium]|nr:hypothetical protein [Cyclobacteriaceae bacterium]